MPTIDSFQGAEGSADAQRRALLTAIATQGTAGRQAVEQAAQAAQAARTASVAAVGQRAGVAGAPAGLAARVASIGAGSADAYKANAAGTSQMLAADSARQASANDTYMQQLTAAIPVSRQLAESYQADALREQQRIERETRDRQWEEANRRKWELQDRQAGREDDALSRRWAMEDREYEVSQRSGEAEGGNPLARLVDGLGGQGLAQTQLRALAMRAIEQAEAGTSRRATYNDTWTSRLRGNVTTGPRTLDAAARARVVDSIGGELGLEPGLLSQFLGDQDPSIVEAEEKPDKPNSETIERVRNKPEYQEWIDEALTAIEEYVRPEDEDTEPLTLSEARARVAANLRAHPYMQGHPVLRDLVLRDALSG